MCVCVCKQIGPCFRVCVFKSRCVYLSRYSTYIVALSNTTQNENANNLFQCFNSLLIVSRFIKLQNIVICIYYTDVTVFFFFCFMQFCLFWYAYQLNFLANRIFLFCKWIENLSLFFPMLFVHNNEQTIHNICSVFSFLY